MGSTLRLMTKSPKEARRCEAFLAPLDGGVEMPGPSGVGCWLEFHGAQVDVSCSAGSMTSDIALFVLREICRRFEVRRIGADSVGWYKESNWKNPVTAEKYPGVTGWVEWAKGYTPEWSYNLPRFGFFETVLPGHHAPGYARELARLQAVEAFVVEKFAELDRLAAGGAP